MPRAALQRLCQAFVAGTIALLVADAVLQTTMAAVSLSTYGSSWTAALVSSVPDRARWVTFALLAWWLVPRLVQDPAPDIGGVDASPGRPEALQLVGKGMMAVPFLWVLSQVALVVTTTIVAANWPDGGRMFLSSSFYQAALLEWAPWLLAGAVLVGWSRHAD